LVSQGFKKVKKSGDNSPEILKTGAGSLWPFWKFAIRGADLFAR
jgi:hypothetical protein